MFGTILTAAVTLMHLYVFWRASTVPVIKRRVPRAVLLAMTAGLWTLFYAGRVIGHGGSGRAARLLETLGMGWMGVLFLVFVSLLAVDLLTLFGLLFRRFAPRWRGWAFTVGVLLSVIALVQGNRPPVIETHDVVLHGLPERIDGTVIVAMSDLHIGSVLGRDWLAGRIAQVQAQNPDIVVLVGDIFEGHGIEEDALLPVLQCLRAPLGVWAVPGNHESHGGSDRGISLMKAAGIQVLSDRWSEVAPGLILAGLDDPRRRRRGGQGNDGMAAALANRADGATILLSHRPLDAGRAAGFGVGLMLSGHTHGGQIWPLHYPTLLAYPLLSGRYEVKGMTVIVSRGAGTWGPRMRLWRPGDILRITLRSATDGPERSLP